MTTTCGRCERPTDAYLCIPCTEDLEKALVSVDPILDELRVTKERQDVGARSEGGGATKLHAPPPVNLHALECEMDLHKSLMDWSLRLVQEFVESWDAVCANLRIEWNIGRAKGAVPAEDAGPVFPSKPRLSGRTPQLLSSYLFGHLAHVRHQSYAPDLAHELGHLLKACVDATDRLEPKIFAGVCPGTFEDVECATFVYEPAGTITARCTVCGTAWDIPEWQGRALLSKEYVTGYPPALSRMLSSGGMPVTENNIREWASRTPPLLTQVNPATVNGRPTRPLYQLGDVMNVWRDIQTRNHHRKQATA